MFKWITYGIIGILIAIFISVMIIRRNQQRRMDEARMRGIKQALREQKQYDTLRKLEGSEVDIRTEVNEYTTKRGRREIRR